MRNSRENTIFVLISSLGIQQFEQHRLNGKIFVDRRGQSPLTLSSDTAYEHDIQRMVRAITMMHSSHRYRMIFPLELEPRPFPNKLFESYDKDKLCRQLFIESKIVAGISAHNILVIVSLELFCFIDYQLACCSNTFPS